MENNEHENLDHYYHLGIDLVSMRNPSKCRCLGFWNSYW